MSDYDEGIIHLLPDMGCCRVGENHECIFAVDYSAVNAYCFWVALALMGLFTYNFRIAMCLVNVMVIDGFAKREMPGSFSWIPWKTDWLPFQWYNVPMMFRSIMAGFTGHAVFPSVYRDMQNPKHIQRWSIILILLCKRSHKNIMITKGYNRILNQFMIWLVAAYPIPKYALIMNPINLTCEIYYHSIPRIEDWCKNGRGRRTTLKVLSRVLTSTIVLLIALQVPDLIELWEY
ncbi:unnamed protein product [Rhizophagus irregularis]|nr:unnamed protein product [Rhizophagus irregularis]